MKKIVILVLSALLLMPAAMDASNRDIKRKLRQFKKESYTVYGSSRTNEQCLKLHYAKLEKEGVRELSAEGVAASANTARLMAKTSAINAYALEIKSKVMGRIGSEYTNLGDTFWAGFETLVAAEMQGQVQESFAVKGKSREKDKPYKVMVFCVVDVEDAYNATVRALEKQAKVRELQREQSDKVSEQIRKGFEDWKDVFN